MIGMTVICKLINFLMDWFFYWYFQMIHSQHQEIIVSGSMPMFWSQTADLSYLPKPVIHKHEQHLQAFILHFQKQFKEYGSQVIILLT
jgi:hypothetical protein